MQVPAVIISLVLPQLLQTGRVLATTVDTMQVRTGITSLVVPQLLTD